MAKRSRETAKARRAPVGVRITDNALAVGKRRVPLFSGAMHYFRLAPDAWRPALKQLRELGLPIVETYIPWGVHETAPGEYDFGTRDPQKDVARFIDLAADEGLLVFARPGPHINAEMTHFGLPERIVYDKACQARSPRQNPVILPFPPQMFPVPSYASSQFHAEVGRWYDAVGQIVGPRIYPNGPVVLLQVDNEAAYYFRNGPYDQDYHPDSVALFHAYLERRYETLEQLGAAHRKQYAAWDDVRPPTRFDAEDKNGLAIHLDWAAFQEELIVHSLSRMRRRMARAGMKGVPVIHNIPLGDGGLPLSIPRLRSVVDLVGLDYYHSAREHRIIKRRTLFMSGTVDVSYAPELGIGAPPWFTPLAHEDSLFTAMCALAYGLRGFNLYMAVDRDRWYGAPIDASGTPRVEAGAWKHLLDRLREHRFHAMTRRAEVALVVPHEYARLARATHLLGPFSPSTLEAIGGTPVDASSERALGFRGPIQVLYWRMLAKVSDALTRAGIPYVYLAGDVDEERVSGYRVIVTPSYEFATVSRWKMLARCAAQGATLVYGPALPSLDTSLRPHPFEVPKNGRRVLLDSPEDADELVQELLSELALERPFLVSPAPVESSVHEDASGPRMLFLLHPGASSLEAHVSLPFSVRLEDLMTGERLAGEERIAVAMSPMSCRVFSVERVGSVGARAVRPRARASRRGA